MEAIGGFAVFIMVLAVFAVIFIAKSVRVVPQQEAWVVERFGKFHTVLQPGLNFIIPIIDRVAYRQTLKEIPMDTSSPNLHYQRQHSAAGGRRPLLSGHQSGTCQLRNVRLCDGHYTACADISQKRYRYDVARQNVRRT